MYQINAIWKSSQTKGKLDTRWKNLIYGIKEKLRCMGRYVLKTIFFIYTNKVILLIDINIFIAVSDKLKLILVENKYLEGNNIKLPKTTLGYDVNIHQ